MSCSSSRLRSEAGQATVEHVGVAVIVCVLIGAVAVGVAATATDLGRTLVC